jgi:hypothetical protein
MFQLINKLVDMPNPHQINELFYVQYFKKFYTSFAVFFYVVTFAV